MKLFTVEDGNINQTAENSVRFNVADDGIGPHISILCAGCGEEHDRLVLTTEEINRMYAWCRAVLKTN